MVAIHSSKIKPLVGLTLLVLLAGCAITPTPFSESEINEINQNDRQVALSLVAPITGVITIDEAISRALKYNLDHRVALLKQSLAAGQFEAGKFDMLPKMMAKAGYSWRDDYSLRYNVNPDSPSEIDEEQSLDLSVDKSHRTADLSLSWNLLDFGASYYTAKQNADRVLIASEQRRKAIHNLIRNVRVAYWRAVAGEKLGQRVKETIKDAERALFNSRKLSSGGLHSAGQSLRYQRNLLENLRLLGDVQRELASARVELTNLMGVLPATKFSLQEPELSERPLSLDMDQLESRALMQNSELREQFYNARIAAQNTRKALLKLLPGISFDYGRYDDNDRYLVNQQWSAAGVRVSFNLFNLLSASTVMNAAEQAVAVEDAKRMALQMSVLTRVHLASFQYNDSLQRLDRAKQIFDVDAQLEQIAKSKSESSMAGEQSKISSSVTSILSNLGRYQAMAKVQESIGKMQASLGMEPELVSIDTLSLEDLGVGVKNWLNQGFGAATIEGPISGG